MRAGFVANIAKIDIFLFSDFLNSRTTYVRFLDGSEFYYRAVQIVTYDNVAGQRRQNMFNVGFVIINHLLSNHDVTIIPYSYTEHQLLGPFEFT